MSVSVWNKAIFLRLKWKINILEIRWSLKYNLNAGFLYGHAHSHLNKIRSLYCVLRWLKRQVKHTCPTRVQKSPFIIPTITVNSWVSYVCENWQKFLILFGNNAEIGSWRHWHEEVPSLVFFFTSFHSYLHVIALMWVRSEHTQINRMRVNCVCALLFCAALIYNSWWCSDSPSNATMRSELHKEHFYLKAF